MSKKKKHRQKSTDQLTGTQLEIMSFVWARGQATVADVWEHLNCERGLARNTVQTMLVRLEEKGFLQHRCERNAFVYSATRERHTAISSILQGFVHSAFGGSTSGLIMTLLENEPLSNEELRRIRSLLKSKTKTREGKK